MSDLDSVNHLTKSLTQSNEFQDTGIFRKLRVGFLMFLDLDAAFPAHIADVKPEHIPIQPGPFTGCISQQ